MYVASSRVDLFQNYSNIKLMMRLSSLKMTSQKNYQKILKDFGSFLKSSRKKQNLSQGDLAAVLGYESPQYISDWERGASSIPMKKLVQVSKALKISEEELFEKVLLLAKARLEEGMLNEYDSVVLKAKPKKRRS